jgi:hypothetical protein
VEQIGGLLPRMRGGSSAPVIKIAAYPGTAHYNVEVVGGDGVKRVSVCSLIFSVTALFSNVALSQEIVGGEKAKRFFERFKNEDRENLNVSFESLTRESDDNKGVWSYSPSQSSTEYHIARHKPGSLSVGVDQGGRRYIEQDGTGVDVTGVDGWPLGTWLKSPGKNPQHSDLSPAALQANRISYLIRMPDELVASDGTIVDVKKDPSAFLNMASFQRGTYNQHDGWGWTDYTQEDSGWHFYYWPAWMKQGANTVKIEPLGNDPRYGTNFLRVTFNTQHATIRSGSIHSRGQFSATDPELATYEGDRCSILRSETRHYINAGKLGEVLKSDLNESTPNPFDDGKRIWHLYGASYWYEDDKVEIVTFNNDKPQGTAIAQELVSLEDPQVIDFPVEIRNTGDSATEFVPSVAMRKDTTLIFNLGSENKGGISLYPDTNRNGVLDGSESSQRVGAERIRISAKGTGRYILRFELAKLDPSPAELLKTQKEKHEDPTLIIDINLTVNAVDPKDVMSLKGSSVHFIVGVTETKAERVKIERRNLYLTGGASLRAMPYNRAPEAKLRAFKVVGKSLTPLTSGSEVTVGDTIRLESFGSRVDGDAEDVAHRFYFPDGDSEIRQESDSVEFVEYKPWRAGDNHFLLHVADGYSRSFEELSLKVKQAGNLPPQAVIDHPQEGAIYPAKFSVFFGSKVGPSETQDPDGGKEGTTRGITKFEWDFGDGTGITTGQFPEHTFGRAGSYNVKLTVTDDEGSRTTVERKITIREENQPPRAKVEAVSLQSFMEFGLVEVTAAGTTDPDQTETNNEGLRYFWSVRGPNGLTDKDLENFTEEAPRYLFVAKSSGRYTVSVTAIDKVGAKSVSEVSFDVKPWDGILRVNMFANQAKPGNSYTNNDLDQQIPKGWSVGYAGQPRSAIGRLGDAITTGEVRGSKRQVRNDDPLRMPAGATPLEAGLFSSSIDTTYSKQLYSFYNLPAGTYEVTAYMLDQENAAPGTEYGIGFQVSEPTKEPTQIGELKTRLPGNPRASDFIIKGRIVIPSLTSKGSIVVTGREPEPSKPPEGYVPDPMRSPLSAIELKRIDGPIPPTPTPSLGAPRNLRITSR